MTQRYDVAAYIWPSYTGDEPRTRVFWPEGMGEWESVRKAVRKNPDHDWPRKPVWGYVNEADRYVMQMQIDAAADHGVNVFIYDWYWYDRRPFLENCLNDGFLKAKNNDRMHFYLMWANHTATSLWDVRTSRLDTPIWDGAVDRAEFERLGLRLVDKYFAHPRYYRIDDKPVFMLYELRNFLKGLGGVAPARAAMDWLRGACAKAGLPGLHWQLVIPYGDAVEWAPGESADLTDAVRELGFDSLTHYQMCGLGMHETTRFPEIAHIAAKKWESVDAAYDIPYFPQVAVGWDNNPRFIGYIPPVVTDATPEHVEDAFRLAKRYLDARPDRPKLLTVNSWNEWTETSYLQPDDKYGYGYLEAIKRVFVE